MLRFSLLLSFLLLLVQTAGANNQTDIYHTKGVSFFLGETVLQQEVKSELYSPDALELPEALLVPLPNFQFALSEAVACFLFVIFLVCSFTKIREITPDFTNSYFHKLFSGIILINAP